MNDLKAQLKGMYPEAEDLFIDMDDSEKMNDNLRRMLSNLKKRIKSQEAELNEKYCEMFHWHPFQEAGNERPYEVNVNEDNWSARIDMPGIGKGVRVWFENNYLHFKGEEKDKGPAGRKYMSKFPIPPGEFNTNEISAVLNNGVLNIVIPRIKASSRNENSDKE